MRIIFAAVTLSFMGLTGCTQESASVRGAGAQSPAAIAVQAPALQAQENITNWSVLIELPSSDPAEKESTWYLDYDMRARNQARASARQGRLLIQPFDKLSQQMLNSSSIMDIDINCYERNFTFGTIRVYDKAYAQGDIIEQEVASRERHFASPRNPIDTGIINFYCKD